MKIDTGPGEQVCVPSARRRSCMQPWNTADSKITCILRSAKQLSTASTISLLMKIMTLTINHHSNGSSQNEIPHPWSSHFGQSAQKGAFCSADAADRGGAWLLSFPVWLQSREKSRSSTVSSVWTSLEEHLLPLSSGRGGPRWRVALVVSLLGFNLGSGRQIDLGSFRFLSGFNWGSGQLFDLFLVDLFVPKIKLRERERV